MKRPHMARVQQAAQWCGEGRSRKATSGVDWAVRPRSYATRRNVLNWNLCTMRHGGSCWWRRLSISAKSAPRRAERLSALCRCTYRTRQAQTCR